MSIPNVVDYNGYAQIVGFRSRTSNLLVLFVVSAILPYVNVLRPKDLQERLGISASTLRLWSDTFASVLSPAASKSTTESGTPAQRRYTDGDLQILIRAKELLGQSKTYDETLELLKSNHTPLGDDLREDHIAHQTSTPAVVLDDHPVMVAFKAALDAKDQALASKDETIEVLRAQVLELQNRQPIPAPQPPTRFRWGFLNKLLLDTETSVDEGKP